VLGFLDVIQNIYFVKGVAMKKNIYHMTRQDFINVEYSKDLKTIEVDSLVILPSTDTIHDSGYMSMAFVGVIADMPCYKFSGYSDVLHMHYENENSGLFWSLDCLRKNGISWSIDCLPKSGLLRVFSNQKISLYNAPTSTFCIECVKGGHNEVLQ